ncbi:MAG: hypothetical protein HC898_12305, partial [Phycisphaerales bacterium]|nr:hypothetical protein [Phycisphaerales bacterium]
MNNSLGAIVFRVVNEATGGRCTLAGSITSSFTVCVSVRPVLSVNVSKISVGPAVSGVKFNTAEKSPSGTFDVLWRVGVPKETKFWQTPAPMSLAPETFHEFEIPPDL